MVIAAGHRRDIGLALALLLVTFLAYLPAIQGEFIWDDDDYVRDNHTLRSLEGLGRIWFELGATRQYYPAVHTSFWLEYQLWGLNPTGYHIVNILLHTLAAALLWLVLRKLAVQGSWERRQFSPCTRYMSNPWPGLPSAKMSYRASSIWGRPGPTSTGPWRTIASAIFTPYRYCCLSERCWPRP